MASQNRVFVSPGVYTSERGLSFVTRNVGVTTLGLVGETVKGPAFQPIFVTNYDEFKSFFGGLNPKKVKDTGYPMYELPYISKSYLSQSNQLFVTRVLGFSGYDAGNAWGITIDGALDPSTSAVTTTTTYSGTYITYTATTAGTVTNISTSDVPTNFFYGTGALDLDFLGTASSGDTAEFGPFYDKLDETTSLFTGFSGSLEVISTGTNISGNTTGVTSGISITYSGQSYSDVDNKLVALLRSRGKYDGDEFLVFDCTGNTTPVGISSTATTAESSPLSTFQLTGTSYFQGAFNYKVSMDRTNKSYLPRVLGRTAQDNTTALFVEEIYQDLFDDLITDDKIRGINLDIIKYGNAFDDYKEEYQPAVTPYIVSEVRGNKVLRLFRFWTISDGNSANKEFKISIVNIKPDDKLFDVEIRSYADTDANKVVLEKFTKCTMDPTSDRFIGRRIGTLDGEYSSRSNYVLVEVDEESDGSDAFPAGFTGFPLRDYTENGNTNVLPPCLTYKTEYTTFEKKRKAYLGLSDIVGIDQDFFDYKGKPDSSSLIMWTGLTDGFHMDIEASAVTIDNVEVVVNSTGGTYNPTFIFQTGNAEFKNDFDLAGTDYEKTYARKFTFTPYGGFDGWDVYRTRRTNTDNYLINGNKGSVGLTSGVFENKALSNGEIGITSDYYAYFEGLRTFANPEATNINVFATLGIDMVDNTNLIEESIEMIETERCDSLYIATLPDVDSGGEILTTEDAVLNIEDMYDSNYTATYWPWVQVNDAENNQLIWLPPTRDVVRNIALTDNIAFPWFAAAGVQRGDVDAIKARKKLTLEERDELYEGRINPIATFASEGIKVWGNKTLQEAETALNRINVRRLLLQARKLISAVSIRLLFEQNDEVVRNQFLSLVNPILDNIRTERGLTDFRVVLDDDPEAIDRNELCGRIFIKPTRALEFICVEFNIMNTGASFDDI
jgi:hypothetical protein